ncbi:Bor family protein [Ferrimonas balearica]|uniref:Bor family protein n=1 Tax=Ferrimonas balearica TaxID=44012 RepID=UPI001C9933AB|nr:Bor family protein [Ferrimonas balearica]MBY5990973.1 Bor family protein [Ferrimonas balearica]
MRQSILAVIVLLGLSACSTVTIKPDPTVTVNQVPSYQDSRHFFLWGLAGEERVNVTEVCGERTVAQMQSQQTFLDGVLGVVTLGIYAPHSVKVWCEDTVLNQEEGV